MLDINYVLLFINITTTSIIYIMYDMLCYRCYYSILSSSNIYVNICLKIHSYFPVIIFIFVYLHIYKMYFYVNNILVELYGLILYILVILLCFLGYSMIYGNLGYWACQVIICLLDLIPNLWYIFKSKYIASSYLIPKLFTLHYVYGFVVLVFIICHLSILHSTWLSNSNNELNSYLFLYILFKDILLLFIFLFILFIVLLSIIIINGTYEINFILFKLWYIVPEWYLLHIYGLLRCIPIKIIGLIGSLFVLLCIVLG